jgi:predicted NBD/HSP70 family sugar kinase
VLGEATVNVSALTASSPRRVRQSNEIAALRALHQFGRLSRADLARKLGLNRSSSGHIIAGLTSSGLVREVVEERPERRSYARAGRPGILLQLVPQAVFFLGVEIGVEHISTVEIDLEANIVTTNTEPLDGPTAGVEVAIDRAVQLAFGAIPEANWNRCEGVGVSIPAQMDRNGFVRLAPLLGWQDLPLAELVRNALPVQVPVLAENDANAFAIGATYGRNAGRAGVTLFLVMESGVGGGIVADGVLFRGANGLAGEIGHLRMGVGDPPERLEQVVGLECIMTAYRKVSGRVQPTFGDFVADVQDRVPTAVSIADEWAKALAFALSQAFRIIDPDRVVLGGSVAALYPLVATRVAYHLHDMQEASFSVPAILVNDDAVLGSAFGAACMMHQRFLSLESARFLDDMPPLERSRVQDG